jgi:hypothetical protein
MPRNPSSSLCKFSNIRTGALRSRVEKKFHLPSGLVQGTNAQGGQCRVVADEQQAFAGLGILVTNAAKRVGVVLGGLVSLQHERLVENSAESTKQNSRTVQNKYFGRSAQ